MSGQILEPHSFDGYAGFLEEALEYGGPQVALCREVPMHGAFVYAWDGWRQRALVTPRQSHDDKS